MNRRALLLAGAALACRPAHATPAEVAAKIREVVGDAKLRPGLVKLDIPELVENGNAVGVTVSVENVPAGLHVASLHLFAEGNPLPNVLHATFGPASGAPRIATRMRLATSQTVVAVARLSDGSCWTDSVTLIVTLAACLE